MTIIRRYSNSICTSPKKSRKYNSGYGDGSGSGYGDGSGYGSGDGCGSGSGDG